MEKNLFFFNGCFDKSRIKFLISWSLKNCGDQITLDLLENLKEMGFLYATKAGVSLGVDDLQIPLTKAQLLQDSMVTMQMAHVNSKKGFVSGIEKFQQLIDTWNRTSETLKQNVINYFKITDILNPVYMMAFSGARGNISQVRQLVGMRGLMSDPQGEILDFPIKSNFREGLTLTEYIISCYGARKGLVDTALRTANAGYLTRRLVDVSHQLVINEFDCKTKLGIKINNIIENNKIIVPLQNRLVGRVLAEYIYDKPFFPLVNNNLLFGSEKPLANKENFFAKQPSKSISQQKSIYFFSLVSYLVCVYFAPNFSNSIWKPWRYYYDTKSKIKLKKNAKIQKFDINFTINQKFVFFQLVLFIQNLYYSNTQLIAFPNKEISLSLATKIAFLKKEVLVRSPLTCEIENSICQLCYGWSLTSDKLITLGEAVGIIAAQSIGEPGTQLTMRTFHTGGVFSGDMINQIKAPSNGIVQFPEFLHGMLIRTPHGKIAFLTKVSGQFDFYFTQNPNLSEKSSTSQTYLKKKINETSTNETGNRDKTIFQKLQLEKLIKKTFEIPSLTILFVRNNQIVTKTQIIAEFSFLLNDQEEHVYANYNLNAEVEGEIFFKKVFVHTKTTENIIRSKKTAKLGSIWILSGQIYKQPIPVALFPQYGDIVDKQSILGQYQSMFPYNNNGFLKILSKNVQNKKPSTDALLNNLKLSWKYNNKINNTNQLLIKKKYIHATPGEPRFADRFSQKQFGIKYSLLGNNSISNLSSKNNATNHFLKNYSTTSLPSSLKQKEKNTQIFVQHSILSFPVHCIQYKKIGYFIPFWNHTKSRFNKASCETFLNNFFLINSLQQEFYNVKKFQKAFYFKSFPKKYHSQTGGMIISDTFYGNSTFSQGESFWLSEENYIFHKKNIILFNLNNSKNKYFDKLVFQNLKPIAQKLPLIWIKKKYIINTKKSRKWLNTTNPLILNSNNQGKISNFYSKLSGCVEISSFYKNFSSFLKKKKNNNNLFLKRKILNKKLYKFKLMSLLKFPTPYCSVSKPVFLQHTYLHIGFRINPIYFINFLLKKKSLHGTEMAKDHASKLIVPIGHHGVKHANLHIEQKILSNYTEQINKIYSSIYKVNKKNKKKTSFSVSPLKKNKLPCLHPQFPWSKNIKTSIDFKLQNFSYHFYKPFFSQKKIVRSFTNKKKFYSELPTTVKFQNSLYPVLPVFWSINNFQLQNTVLVKKKQTKTNILSKLDNNFLTNELIINQLDTNLKNDFYTTNTNKMSDSLSLFKWKFLLPSSTTLTNNELKPATLPKNGLNQKLIKQQKLNYYVEKKILNSKNSTRKTLSNFKKSFLFTKKSNLIESKIQKSNTKIKQNKLFTYSTKNNFLNVKIKPGWIYFPKNSNHILHKHKSILKPGKKCCDTIIFDQYPVYIECISIEKLSVQNKTNSIEKNLYLKNSINTNAIYTEFYTKNYISFYKKFIQTQTFKQHNLLKSYPGFPNEVSLKAFPFVNQNQLENFFQIIRKLFLNTYSSVFFHKNFRISNICTKNINLKFTNEPSNLFNEIKYNTFLDNQYVGCILEKCIKESISTKFYLIKNKNIYNCEKIYFLKNYNFSSTKNFFGKSALHLVDLTKNFTSSTRQLLYTNVKTENCFSFQLKQLNTKNNYYTSFSSTQTLFLPKFFVFIRKIKSYSFIESRQYKRLFVQQNQSDIDSLIQTQKFTTTSLKRNFTKLICFNKQEKDSFYSIFLFENFPGIDFKIKSHFKYKKFKKKIVFKNTPILEFSILVIIPHQYPITTLKINLIPKPAIDLVPLNLIRFFSLFSNFSSRVNSKTNKLDKKLNLTHILTQNNFVWSQNNLNKITSKNNKIISGSNSLVTQKKLNLLLKNKITSYHANPSQLEKTNFFYLLLFSNFKNTENINNFCFFAKQKNKLFFNSMMNFNISFFQELQLSNNATQININQQKQQVSNDTFGRFSFTANGKIKIDKNKLVASTNETIKNTTLDNVVAHQQKAVSRLQNTLVISSEEWLSNQKPVSITKFFSPYSGEILEPLQENQIKKSDNFTQFGSRSNFSSFSLSNKKNKFECTPYELEDYIPEDEIVKAQVKTLTEQNCVILTNEDQISFSVTDKFSSPNQLTKSLLGRFVEYGFKLNKNSFIPESGQIIQIEKSTITVRKAQVISYSSKSFLSVQHGNIVEKNTLVLRILYQKLETGDIVQGIPKIEQIFEASKPKRLPGSLYRKLQWFFEFYKTKYDQHQATKYSLYKIQPIIVKSIQKVYQSQGVTIAEKHFEIIVRQMTSKVRIAACGKTRFVPGETVDLNWIDNAIQSMHEDFEKPVYNPVVVGITKKSLESKSFLSAASFQETTRILAKSSLEYKADFLQGLKENVILGYAIPAGTGFPIQNRWKQNQVKQRPFHYLGLKNFLKNKKIKNKKIFDILKQKDKYYRLFKQIEFSDIVELSDKKNELNIYDSYEAATIFRHILLKITFLLQNNNAA